MRWSRAAFSVAIMVGLMSTGCLTRPQQGAQTRTVLVMGTPFDSAVTTVQTQELPAPLPDIPPPVPLASVPVLSAEGVEYVLRTSPPDDLIRYVWRAESPAVIERALEIACREGGMGKGPGKTWREACSPSHRHPAVPYDPSCGADNPTSSASGLVQFIGGKHGWQGWGGYDWSLIVGRDCLEDVRMFYAAWQANGWGPWE